VEYGLRLHRETRLGPLLCLIKNRSTVNTFRGIDGDEFMDNVSTFLVAIVVEGLWFDDAAACHQIGIIKSQISNTFYVISHKKSINFKAI